MDGCFISFENISSSSEVMQYIIYNYLPLITVLVVLIYLFFNNYENASKKTVYWLIVFWIGFWTIEYWILGPYSHIHYYDEAEIGVSRYLHDINNHIGGNFLHGIQGGADFYGSQLIGGQYLSLERLLLYVFPFWVGLLIHKLMVVSISTLGAYVLSRRATKVKRFYAFCLSAFFSMFNAYAVYSTIHHGVGYAIVPFAIYIFVYRSGKKYYLTYATLLSALIAISCSPTHSFVVIFFGILLSTLIFPLKNYPKFIVAILILPALIILNWSEVLYGISQYSLMSARVLTGSEAKSLLDIFLGALPYFYRKTDYILFNIRFSPALILVIITLIMGFVYRLKIVNKIAVNIFIVFYISSLIYLIPWNNLGLSFIYSVNFNRLSYYAIIPVCLLAAHLTVEKKNIYTRLLPILFLTFSVFILTHNKARAFIETFGGNQLRITSISNLKNRKWEPDEPYRTVTAGPYLGIHPNFLWAYGIETLDGYVNMVPKKTVDFWHYGIHRNSYTSDEPDFIGGNMYITYIEKYSAHANPIDFASKKYIDLDEFIDINMLKLGNVSHIVSYIPLRGKDLVKVSGPDDSWNKSIDEWSLKEKLINGLKKVFKPDNVFIYSIGDFSKRAYFPDQLVYINDDLNPYQKFRFISDHYHENNGYTVDKDLHPGSGEILAIKKIPNGYEIDAKVENPGVLILNTYPLPYWESYVDGISVETFPINEISLGINIPVGVHKIIFIYKRELFRDKIFNYFKKFL